jgi:ATP-dependent Clp protease protease subunit
MDTTPAPSAPNSMTDHVAARLLHQRILVLDRELDEDNGIALCEQLVLLASEDARSDITLLINSPGGLVHEMLAIADLMAVVPCDVRTVALGIAASAGQFLLTAGTPGKRYALPHARVLMHQGSAGFGGSAVDVGVQAGNLRRNRDLVIDLTAAATGRSRETIARDSDRDRWWDARSACEYGFVDHVATSFGEVVPGLPARMAGLGR